MVKWSFGWWPCISWRKGSNQKIHFTPSFFISWPLRLTSGCSPCFVSAPSSKWSREQPTVSSTTLVESLAIPPDAVPDIYGNYDEVGCSTIPTYSPQEHQKFNPIIGQVVHVLEGGDEANLSFDSMELKLFCKERKRLEVKKKKCLLYRTRQLGNDLSYKLVAPKCFLSWHS